MPATPVPPVLPPSWLHVLAKIEESLSETVRRAGADAPAPAASAGRDAAWREALARLDDRLAALDDCAGRAARAAAAADAALADGAAGLGGWLAADRGGAAKSGGRGRRRGIISLRQARSHLSCGGVPCPASPSSSPPPAAPRASRTRKRSPSSTSTAAPSGCAPPSCSSRATTWCRPSSSSTRTTRRWSAAATRANMAFMNIQHRPRRQASASSRSPTP